jgi:hypothetical protein
MTSKIEPRVCYIPLDKDESRSGLEPIGIDTLKQDFIREAILFKCRNPDEGLRVTITPSITGNYLKVESDEPTSRVIPRNGDYLLTEDGHFIGIMVNENTCYAAPLEIPFRRQLQKIPISKKISKKYYEDFVDTIQELKRTIGRHIITNSM